MPYLISLILLLLPAYLIRFNVFGIPSTALEVAIYIVFLYGLFRAFKVGFRPLKWQIWLPIAVLAVALIISTIISPDKRTALGEFKGFFIDPLLFLWVLLQFGEKKDFPMYFAGLGLSGTFVAIHTITLKILGNVTPDGRVIGIFGYSPNYLALFLAPITIMTIAYSSGLLAQKKYFFAVGGFFLSAIDLLAIYFSGSRGGIMAVVFGIGAFVLAHYWPWIRERFSAKIIIVILVLIAIYTSWTFLRPDFSASPSSGRVASSNNVRFQIWQASWELVREHPRSMLLGVGLGNFQNAFDKLTHNRANFPEYISPLALTPHNLYLMFWLSTGLLGLLSLLLMFGVFFYHGLKKITGLYVPLVLAVMVAIALYGVVEATIGKNDLSVIFFFFWGLVWLI